MEKLGKLISKKIIYLSKAKWVLPGAFILVIFIITSNLLLLYAHTPYNSDDAALMVMTKFFHFRMLPSWMPPDIFFLKAPFNTLSQLVLGHTSAALFLSAWLALLVGILLFGFTLYKIVKDEKIIVNRLHLALACTAFLALPSFVYNFSLRSPHIRTLEIGIAFIIMYAAVRFLTKPHTQKHTQLFVAIFTFSLGIFFLNDPAFIFFVGLPIAVLSLLKILENKNTGRALTLLIAVGTSLVTFKLLGWGLGMVGIREYDMPTAFVSLDQLSRSFELSLNGIFALFGADFWGGLLSDPKTIIKLLYTTLIVYGAAAVYVAFKKGNDIERLFSLSVIISLTALIFSARMTDLYSARYLILLPFLLSFLVYATVTKNYLSSKFTKLFPLAFAVIVVLNIAIPGVRFLSELRSNSHYDRNSINYKIKESLDKSNVEKGYAGYFMANINTYYSQPSQPIIPILCNSEGIRPFYWVMYEGYIGTPAEKSYIIASDNNLLPHITTNSEDIKCTQEKIIEKFGAPSSTSPITKGTTIMFYDFDIGDRLDQRKNMEAP
jgi:hypothetical protein